MPNRSSHYGERIDKHCLQCGKPFTVKYEHRVKKLCSRECADLFRRNRVQRICPACGGAFEALGRRVKKGEAIFCSRACAAQAMPRGPERERATVCPGPIELGNCVWVTLESSIERKEVLLDADLLDWFLDYPGGWRIRRDGYVASSRDDQYLHRLICNPPPDKLSDHINRDKLDDRRANLRVVSHYENALNQGVRQTSRSKYKGVWVKPDGRFAAHIKAHGKRYYLGRFDTELDAALAYDTAARDLHGEHAGLNFSEAPKRVRA